MNQVMIDLETMGACHNAAIVSIGAAFFDLKNCVIGKTFHRKIHLATAVRSGGVIEASTVLWWLGQSEPARNGIRFGGEENNAVLLDFAEWLQADCKRDEIVPWGNSASFDCGILADAYKRQSLDVPWSFWNERCFRTARNLFPQITYDTKEKGDTAHDALADAIFQINHLFKIKNRNKKAEPAEVDLMAGA